MAIIDGIEVKPRDVNLVKEARVYVRECGRASQGILMKRFHLSQDRAERILGILERLNVVTPIKRAVGETRGGHRELVGVARLLEETDARFKGSASDIDAAVGLGSLKELHKVSMACKAMIEGGAVVEDEGREVRLERAKKGGLAGIMRSYYYWPLEFVEECFEWGEGDLTDFEGPLEWQREALANIGERVRKGEQQILQAIRSGHGVGKGAYVTFVQFYLMYTRVNMRGQITANSHSQLSQSTWAELSLWKSRLRDFCFGDDVLDKTQMHFRHKLAPETWMITARNWDKGRSQAFAGLHAPTVFNAMDEASEIPSIIYEVVLGTMTTGEGFLLLTGNPTELSGFFYDVFKDANYGEGFYLRQVNGEDVPITSKPQYEKWARQWGKTSDNYRIRVLGEFPRTSRQQVISRDIVDEAIDREAPDDMEEPLIFGVDVAHGGESMSALIQRRGRRMLPDYLRVDSSNWPSFADLVADFASKSSPDAVIVDCSGMGGGFADLLDERNIYNVVRFFGGHRARDDIVYANRRAETWFDMAEWLKGADIPEVKELIDDLLMMKYSFQAGGTKERLLLMAKREMEKMKIPSPDMGDALALTFGAKVLKVGGARRRNRGRSQPMPRGEAAWMGY